MYKLNLDPPAGNFITQIVERQLLQIEAKVVDKRVWEDKKNQPPEDKLISMVLFIEDDTPNEPLKLWERVSRIVEDYGYRLITLVDPFRTTYTYDVGKAYIRAKTK